MRIAIDVIGTLEGHKRAEIITMIRELVKDDHEVVVWSSEFSMAMRAAEKLTVILNEYDGFPGKIEFMSKRTKTELDPDEHFDYAIEDDRNQVYLAAKQFIWVQDLPREFEACKELARSLK